MASSTMLSFNARFCPLRLFSSSSSSSRTMLSCYGSGQLSPLNKVCSSLRLRSSHNIIGSHALFLQKPCTVSNLTQRLHSLNVFAAKGYKMKTHKASAKRFRVTGKGKIVRRRAGKQHLLAKKNTKRKWRLSKMPLFPFWDCSRNSCETMIRKINRVLINYNLAELSTMFQALQIIYFKLHQNTVESDGKFKYTL